MHTKIFEILDRSHILVFQIDNLESGIITYLVLEKYLYHLTIFPDIIEFPVQRAFV